MAALIGAFAGGYARNVIPFWQLFLYFAIFLAITVSFLKIIGKKWRQAKGIDEEALKPNIRAERFLFNSILGATLILFIVALVVNLLAASFNWAWMGVHLFVVFVAFVTRGIHLRRLYQQQDGR
ncbi:hypothetical protein [Shouchella shacheensis]|uniref:hypothetical protein n=1 Tax=Shouchella shacheensis TaxID=1649580 RepID=UPI0007400210|nr:hypothetical protein [Shouchella shacheensis]